MRQYKILIDHACINELRMLVRRDPIAFVDVTKYMNQGLNSLDELQEIPASHTAAVNGQIAVTVRRTMCDQHLRVFRDQLPFCPDFGPAPQVESPIMKPGLPGAAVESNAVRLV